MSLIYITGSSATGKSAVRNELVKRGCEAHDTDENGLSDWYNNQTDELVELPDEKDRSYSWYEKHDYRMSSERFMKLVEAAKHKTIFICGLPANDLDFVKYYDKIFFLDIDLETMKQRLNKRDTNNFGKSPDELKFILHWQPKILDRYKKLNATMIDATQPLVKVVDSILKSVDSLSFKDGN